MYRLVLENGMRTVLFESNSREVIIHWTDDLLDLITRKMEKPFSLMNRLNDLQRECGSCVFPIKYDIPFGVINLLLKDFNLALEER